jgi:hypothetical protein
VGSTVLPNEAILDYFSIFEGKNLSQITTFKKVFPVLNSIKTTLWLFHLERVEGLPRKISGSWAVSTELSCRGKGGS